MLFKMLSIVATYLNLKDGHFMSLFAGSRSWFLEVDLLVLQWQPMSRVRRTSWKFRCSYVILLFVNPSMKITIIGTFSSSPIIQNMHTHDIYIAGNDLILNFLNFQ